MEHQGADSRNGHPTTSVFTSLTGKCEEFPTDNVGFVILPHKSLIEEHVKIFSGGRADSRAQDLHTRKWLIYCALLRECRLSYSIWRLST